MSEHLAQNWRESYIPTEPEQQEEQKVVKVRKKGWITVGEKILYSAVGTMLIAASMYVVSFASSTDTLNRKVETLEETVQNQKVTNEGLLYEKKELKRPERIIEIAKDNGLKIQDARVKQAAVYHNN